MTREEAIEVFGGLDELEAISPVYQRGGKADGLSIHRIKEASRMAIAALRAQQTPAKLDRSWWEEGCIECAAPSCVTCKFINVIPGYEPCISCSKYEKYNPFKFCLYWGRPLTEEAWAELERRINGGATD